MSVIRGAVEGIDVPDVFGIGEGGGALLGHDSVTGERTPQASEYRDLGGAVDLGDEIEFAPMFNADAGPKPGLLDAAGDDAASAATARKRSTSIGEGKVMKVGRI